MTNKVWFKIRKTQGVASETQLRENPKSTVLSPALEVDLEPSQPVRVGWKWALQPHTKDLMKDCDGVFMFSLFPHLSGAYFKPLRIGGTWLA